jgi:hypothetical protein
MTHAATAKAKRREADRIRKQRERAERRAAGAPEPHQVDLAVTEAIAFVLASTLIASGKVTDTLPMAKVVKVANGILERRWGCDRGECKKALKARLGRRDEHDWPNYYPRLPKLQPTDQSDTSRADTANTPVTHTGQVLRSKPEVTEI